MEWSGVDWSGLDWTPFQWWILPKYFILDESPYGLWGGQQSIADVRSF